MAVGKIKIYLLLITAFLVLLPGYVLPQQDNPVKDVDIEKVTVQGRRILTEIGTQRTELDTVAIRENITKSMADVLSQSSSIYIKSYGRATLSTASFRGTAPSHTQVLWNDMKVNSPMLGMVDFSLIPSYFIDDVTLYHGASSVGVTGGGLGGAITLDSKPAAESGLRYIQGISSYNTWDQFLKAAYGGGKFSASTRVFYARSDNDFKYTNYRKKIFNYNDAGEVTGSYYPVEKNRNGSFKDFHIQQDLYYRTGNGDNFALSAWYMDSRRGVPMLNVDYKEESRTRNEQDERTLRMAASWDRIRGGHKLYARAGYTYTDLGYIYLGDVGTGNLIEITHSRSYLNTAHAKAGGDYYIGDKWLFSGSAAIQQHFLKSVDRSVISQSGQKRTVGYEQSRAEISAFASVRYRPVKRLGLALNVREELYGSDWSPPIPALFAEYVISERGNVVLKSSAARNYRYPTLNDLYFMPAGNPDLKPEKGFTYDAGIGASHKTARMDISGEATYYDSNIKDWILWIARKGFWTPVNVKRVHSYGVELKARFSYQMTEEWWIYLSGIYTLTKAVNHGEPISPGDRSGGRQLAYIPEKSDALTGRLGWKSWVFTYRFNYYGERYTATSNQSSAVGRISPYYMSDISLEKSVDTKILGLNFKIAVNNIFDEEYESVLSRPMAGRNYGFFIEITPKFRKKPAP